jgi:hypothetical protein
MLEVKQGLWGVAKPGSLPCSRVSPRNLHTLSASLLNRAIETRNEVQLHALAFKNMSSLILWRFLGCLSVSLLASGHGVDVSDG